MFNAMILPYAEGPMALRGITFYQGEANTANATTADQYSCLFPQMISAWRQALGDPSLWFGFIQLSTWCALPPQSLPQMREAQMAALSLPNVGYATNADHGFGCNIHPSAKQYCSKRLAHTALSQVYREPAFAAWRSPSYQSGTQLVHSDAYQNPAEVSLVISLNDVSTEGLKAVRPFNYASPQYGSNASAPLVPVDCTATFPATYPNKTAYNASMAEQCAWASLHVGNLGWLNATVSVAADKMTLTAALPAMANADNSTVRPIVKASAYGWGPIPMMTGACHIRLAETALKLEALLQIYRQRA
jgi:sialate O-acetylesterase